MVLSHVPYENGKRRQNGPQSLESEHQGCDYGFSEVVSDYDEDYETNVNLLVSVFIPIMEQKPHFLIERHLGRLKLFKDIILTQYFLA